MSRLTRPIVLAVMACLSFAAAGAEETAGPAAATEQQAELIQLVRSVRADDLFVKAMDARLSGDWKAERQYLDAAKQMAPESVQIRRNLLEALFELKDADAFKAEADALQKLAPNCAAPCRFRGDWERREGRWDEALAQYKAAGDLENRRDDPDLAPALRYAVELYIQKNDAANAVSYSEKLVAMPHPGEMIDRLRLARLYELAGKDELARKQFEAVIRLDDAQNAPVLLADVMWRLTRLCRKLNDPAAADRYLLQMLDIGGAQAHREYGKAVALAAERGKEEYEKGDYAAAYEFLRRAATLDPSVRVYLAKAAVESGRPAVARDILTDVLKESPDNLEALMAALKAAHELHDAKAEQSYRERTIGLLNGALAKQNDVMLRYFLGTLQMDDGRLDEAIVSLKKALDEAPTDKLKFRAQLALSQAYERAGQIDAAIGMARTMLSESDAPIVHEQAARLLLTKGQELGAAEMHARAALKGEPRNERYLGLLLDIVLRRFETDGKSDQVIGAFDWIDGLPDGKRDAQLLRRMGDVCAAAGVKDRAGLYWRRALQTARDAPGTSRELILSIEDRLRRSEVTESKDVP